MAGGMRAPKFPPKRMFASATLLAVGLATVAVGVQQLSSFTSSIGDPIAISLCFLGSTLIGAGALSPFHRTVTGALAGFALSLLYLASM
jgi:hypothetical protein